MLLVFDSRFVLVFLAAHKNFKALTELGYCYEIGLGIEKNVQEAARLYRLAADQRYPYAQFLLAQFCMNGKGAKQDDQEAIRLFRAAAFQGHSWSCLTLGFCHKFEIGVETNKLMAACFYRLAGEFGSTNMQQDIDGMNLSSVCLLMCD
jgi:TPR repeat protein